MKHNITQSPPPPSLRSFLSSFARFTHIKYAVLGAMLVMGTAFLLQNNEVQNDMIRVPRQIATVSGDEYDLPTLLQIPSLIKKTDAAAQHANQERAARLSSARPSSVIAIYRSISSKCAVQPYIPQVKEALRQFAITPGRSASSDEKLVRDNRTLLLTISSAEVISSNISLSPEFIAQVIERARDFSRVILLTSLAKPSSLDVAKADITHITRALNHRGISVTRHRSIDEDEDVYLMHIAKHLMVHRGPFSALGALINTGSVYYTSDLDEYMKKNQFKWLLNDGHTAVHTTLPKTQQIFERMGPVHPSCCLFEPFGKKDGEKILCANAKSFTQEKCWIMSLGCNGQFSFEKSIAERTNCYIHTFDCTGDWPVPEYLEGRLTIHKTCLGADDNPKKNFVGWEEALEMGKTEGASKMPSLVKMDIEGSEFPVLLPLLANGNDSLLPNQMAIEIHQYDHTVNLFSALFENFTKRGYSMVHRVDNPRSARCSEVTILKQTDLPPAV